MLRQLGFLLKFTYEKKGVQEFIKDANKITAGFARFRKSIHKALQDIGGMFFNVRKAQKGVNDAMQEGAKTAGETVKDTQSHFHRLHNTFTNTAQMMARALLNPATALLGFGAALVKSSKDFDAVMKNIRTAGTLTEDQIDQLGTLVQDLVPMTLRSVGEVGSVVATLITRQTDLSLGEAKKLTTLALRSADLFKTTGEDVADFYTKLRTVYGASTQDVLDLSTTIVAAGKVGYASFEELYGGVKQLDEALAFIPKNLRTKLLPEFAKTMAVISRTTLNPLQVITNSMRSLTDLSKESREQIQQLFARGGLSDMFETLHQDALRGDTRKVMEGIVQAVQAIPLEDLRELASVWESKFGLSLDTLVKIQSLKIGEEFARVDAEVTKALSNSEYFQEVWENSLSIGRKFFGLLNRLSMLITSKGIAGIMESIVDGLGWLIGKIESSPWIKNVVKFGTIFTAAATAMLTVKAVMGLIPKGFIALVSPATIFVGLLIAAYAWLEKTFGITDKIAVVWNSLPNAVQNSIIGVAALTAAVWGLSKAWGAAKVAAAGATAGAAAGGAAAGKAGSSLSKFGKGLWRLAGWLGIAEGGMLLGEWLGEMGARHNQDQFSKLSEERRLMLDRDRLTGIYGFGHPEVEKVTKRLQEIWSKREQDARTWESNMRKMGAGGQVAPQPEKKMAEGGMVMPRRGGSFLNVAEAGRPEIIADPNKLRYLLGVDDMVNAIWGAARYMVEEMGNRPTVIPVASPYNPPGFSPSSFVR